jgi:small nuclear ribonucleoprotein (snRNP)-like protein
MYLRRLKGRKSKALRDVDIPIIIELKNGEVYGGRVDDYLEGGELVLYSCKLLDKESHRWVDHDRMIEFEGKVMPDDLPYFRIADIQDIFVLPRQYADKLDLEDVLQIYIDPHYKPVIGIKCNGGGETKHSSECDSHLHEALSVLRTEASLGPENRDRTRQRKLAEAFDYIRRQLLKYGARIP